MFHDKGGHGTLTNTAIKTRQSSDWRWYHQKTAGVNMTNDISVYMYIGCFFMRRHVYIRCFLCTYLQK